MASVVGAVCEDAGVFPEDDQTVVVDVVVSGLVLCSAVVVLSLVAEVRSLEEGVRGRGAGGGGWMNCRLSEGNGSEELTRL